MKSRYLASANFQQPQTRHLAMKLVSRWTEFNDATGFAIDTGILSGLADNRTAIAVYDIGRLDLALVAPVSEAKLAACRFFQGKENFEEIALPDGAVYYLHDVEADKGRQKQQIGFAAVKGKFVLATNEKLLLRAIANLNGQMQKDRLSDEPSFQALSKTVAPHFATVWVDLLAALMTRRQPDGAIASASPVHELTVIRLNQRAEAFDRIFAKLDEPRVKAYWKERKGEQATPSDPSREFFSGEIASLLDVASPVAEARIERSYAGGRMREMVSLTIR